jgi:hypothetical protein
MLIFIMLVGVFVITTAFLSLMMMRVFFSLMRMLVSMWVGMFLTFGMRMMVLLILWAIAMMLFFLTAHGYHLLPSQLFPSLHSSSRAGLAKECQIWATTSSLKKGGKKPPSQTINQC